MTSETSAQRAVGMSQFLWHVEQELAHARLKHGAEPFHSLHEAYAVLLEEVDEVWDLVRTSPPERERDQGVYNRQALYDELVQVAAMALRMATEVCA